jgi:hypothetical protein
MRRMAAAGAGTPRARLRATVLVGALKRSAAPRQAAARATTAVDAGITPAARATAVGTRALRRTAATGLRVGPARPAVGPAVIARLSTLVGSWLAVTARLSTPVGPGLAVIAPE